MARRNDHRPEELKALTLKLVDEFLQNEPAHQLSLRKAAKLVGYSAGTLINLFGSYSYLLLAVNGETMDRLADKLQQAIEAASSPKQKLVAMAHAYQVFALTHPHHWRLVFEHRLAEGEAIPEWQQQRIDRLLLLVAGCVAPIYPDIDDDTLQLRVRTIWASVHGIVQLTLEDKLFGSPGVDGGKLIDDLLENCLPVGSQT
ncbi:TetR/AcrR family transcriptional regulator [Corallincola platygyrae]|uniref:TetR/AcrR family transcriptional regulator n=1 Tax=Corallincola platygyrae TaxID=1193278 RepID=A0ABW4XN62_9GAMM